MSQHLPALLLTLVAAAVITAFAWGALVLLTAAASGLGTGVPS